jgi:hypothetical protein
MRELALFVLDAMLLRDMQSAHDLQSGHVHGQDK